MVCYTLTLTIQKLSVAEEVAASSFVSPVTPSGELPRQMGDGLWIQTEQDRGAEGEKHRVCFLWEPQQSPNEYLNTLLIHTLSLRFFITALPPPAPSLSILFSLAVRFKFVSCYSSPLSPSLAEIVSSSCGAPGCNQITATEMECIRS